MEHGEDPQDLSQYDNQEQYQSEKKAQQEKFASLVMYFVFPIVSYIAAVVISYPMSVATNVSQGSTVPPEQGITPLGVILGLVVGLIVSRKVHRSLTSDHDNFSA